MREGGGDCEGEGEGEAEGEAEAEAEGEAEGEAEREGCALTLERKVISTRCFCGNLRHMARMASTTTILNSSAISPMNEVICFISRSTPDSEPVLSRVVIARVAIERFESLISCAPGTLPHGVRRAGFGGGRRPRGARCEARRARAGRGAVAAAAALTPSMSMLHGMTASGWTIATLLSVRTAAKRRHGLGEHRKSCSTVTAGASSRCVTPDREQIADAAS